MNTGGTFDERPVDLTRSWRGHVIVCSGMSWDSPWMSEKHMAVQLAEHVPVLFVDPATSVLRLLKDPARRHRLREPRLVQVGPNIARLTPLAPPGVSRPGVRQLARAMMRQSLRRASGKLGGPPHAVIAANLENVFGVAGEQIRVLYGTDDFAAGASLMGLSPDWVAQQEAAQLARVNRVVGVTESLVERWRGSGREVALIPNGCDAARYADVDDAPEPPDVTLLQPIAGVIGHLSERLDIRHLEAVADSGESLLLVGPLRPSFEPERIAALIARPNVQWVGPKSFDELPSYLKVMKVGLTPYAQSDFNKASFPLKTLEYLAAGRASISTDLPASRWLNSPLVTIADSPEDFAAATVSALAHTDDAALIRARRDFAAEHSWQSRVEKQFLPLLGLSPATVPTASD